MISVFGLVPLRALSVELPYRRPRFIAQVVGQLGVQRAFDQRTGELLQQPVGPG